MRVASVQSVQFAALPRFLCPPAPTVFTLEITRQCLHHCVGCGNVFEHTSHQELDLKVWTEIITRLRPHIQALRITGGEPTLHKQFSEIMQLVDSLGVPLVLFTNGNWKKPLSVIQTLKQCANLRGILVSLHGIDETTYKKFSGINAFARVINNIRLATNTGLRVATNSLLLTTTVEHLEEIAHLSISLGCSTVSFGRYYGKPLSGLSLSHDQLIFALKQIGRLHQQDPRINLSNCVPTCFLPDLALEPRGCTSGINHCTIGPAGDVRPCTHTPLTLGYIQQDEIEVIWQSQLLYDWRNRIPSNCLGCAVFNRCRGGCRATAQEMELSHDPLMTVPLTEIASIPSVELATDDHPKLKCVVKTTSYGYSLEGAGHFVTLSSQSKPILQLLDGTYTVQQIEDQFGPVALQLIGSLLQKRMVELQ